MPLEIESTGISSPAVRGRGGNAADLINRLEYPTTDYNRQLNACPHYFRLHRFLRWFESFIKLPLIESIRSMSLQSAEILIVLWKPHPIAMYPGRIHRCGWLVSTEYGVLKIALAWSKLSRWTRQPWTMKTPSTSRPVSTKKEHSEIANAHWE